MKMNNGLSSDGMPATTVANRTWTDIMNIHTKGTCTLIDQSDCSTRVCVRGDRRCVKMSSPRELLTRRRSTPLPPIGLEGDETEVEEASMINSHSG